MVAEEGGVSRAMTSLGFHRIKKSRSFFLPPPEEVSRSKSLGSQSVGWQDTPYPHPRKGRIGALIDFLLAIYREIPIIAPLATRLIRLLGLGFKAYAMMLRLILFAASLSPAITKAGVWWWRTKTISRGVRYGPNARNFLDIYHVKTDETGDKYPVVFYVTGGAWIIGYKAWAAPLGEYLCKHGVMMVALDYRNFPQGTLKDMVEDVDAGLDWVYNNIERFGGDRQKILVVGQSAGAQILSSLMLRKAAATNAADPHRMPLSAWKKFIGVSGPYDIVGLAPKMHQRGLYSSMLRSIMDSDLFAASPARQLMCAKREVLDRLPPILLLHGTGDNTVPFTYSVDFFESLKKLGADSALELWPGVTHSEPLVEGPAGGNNFLGARLVLEATGEEGIVKSDPLMNEFMIRMAKTFMPF